MFRSAARVTAIVALLSITALAQEALPSASSPTPTQLQQSGLTPPTVLSEGYAARASDILVTQLLGQTVYTSTADDAQEIGTINDMVVTTGEGLSAVVIGVGGFLGIGAKDVAINFDQLEWATREDGTRRWVLDATAETLTNAPAFIWGDSEEVTGEPAMSPAEEEAQLVDGNPNGAPVDPALTTDEPERQRIATPLDRTGFADFDETGLTAEELRGIAVYGINDEQIGTIGDILTNADGSFDAVIVDVGGFLGLGAKPVAVGFDNLAFSSDTAGTRYLFLNTTREQLEAQPGYDAATYETDRQAQRMVITP